MTMHPCRPEVFDLKLAWACLQPGFVCRRTGDTLEYLLDGEPYLRVERRGEFAVLFERLAESSRTAGTYK